MTPNNKALDPKGVALLIVLCASWGLNQVAIKAAIQDIPPVFQAGIRSIGASILVLIWMGIKRRPILARDHTLWWGVAAGILFSLEFILIYWGLEFTNASRSVIFLNTSPFVVALGAQLFIPGEGMGRYQIIGLCLAFIGVFLAFNESMNLPTRTMMTGDLMLIGAAIVWGATTVVIKAGPLARIAPTKILLYQLAVSALVLPLASLALGEPLVDKISLVSLASLVYQTVWIAFVTYVAWFWLISNYAVSRLSSFTFLTPFFGVAAGALLLGEPLSLRLILSLVMVGWGIYLVNRRI